ncbi:MAG: SDR family oxidoreductase [Sphingobacteriales bacterium]|nr:MAG: SDR family oxidoreductase [Sphingobacteriales bacterium]
MDFKGKVAIVTGAASGIGLATANMLLQNGAFVTLLDINKESLITNFGVNNPQTLLFAIDITQQAEVKNAVEETVKQWQKVDILVNSAGITGITNVKSHLVDSDNLHKVFELNFMASFYTSNAVLPYMVKQNYGRILHLASIAGKEGNAGMLAYSASKAAVIGMAKVQGKEYAEYNITVNALAPAVIQTALVDMMPAEQVKYMTDKIPMKRCGTLTEAAQMIAYIVSEENSFTTGFTFDLSGGRATY